MNDERDEEVLEDSEAIRRMVLVDSNLDEIWWVNFWVWIADLGCRLGSSRNDLIDESVEEGRYDQLKSSKRLNESWKGESLDETTLSFSEVRS